MTVIVFTCPKHGVIVEYDAPGPEHPPMTCPKILATREYGAKRTTRYPCGKRLLETRRNP